MRQCGIVSLCYKLFKSSLISLSNMVERSDLSYMVSKVRLMASSVSVIKSPSLVTKVPKSKKHAGKTALQWQGWALNCHGDTQINKINVQNGTFVTPTASLQLQNKLSQLATQAGYSSYGNNLFVISPNVIVNTIDKAEGGMKIGRKFLSYWTAT